MDMLSFVLFLLLACIVIIILSNAKKKDCNTNIQKLPPSIPFISILRNFLGLMGTKQHTILTELSRKHGPLMSVKIGTVQIVIISSSTMAKEALQKNDISFSNRWVLGSFKVINHHESSLGWLPASSPVWRNLRKICNTYVFSSYRLNASKGVRVMKVNDLLCYVKKCSEAGRAVDIGQAAYTTILNLLSYTFFSVDIGDLNSEVAHELGDALRALMDDAGKPNLPDFFPFLKMIDPQGIRGRLAVNYRKTFDIFNTLINERLQGKRPSDSIQDSDFLDALLGIIQEKAGEIETELIPHLLVDLFTPGLDTTASTLEWAMAEILRNPRVLKKVKHELRETVGEGNAVLESDITRLPYLRAVVKETLRLYPAVPLMPRSVNSDVNLFGYTIPKNAFVIVNTYAIGRDPDIWERPNTFEPERFLSTEIDFKGHDFEFIPFGAGRKICPGLALADRMLHLMIASLVHEYDWKVEGIGINMEDEYRTKLKRAQKLRIIPIPVRV